MAITNRGFYRMLSWAFRGATRPSSFYLALVTDATPPTVGTVTLGTLTQITAGNGYTSGGIQLTANSTDFDTLTQDDAAGQAYIQVRDVSWTASGGSIPPSGSGASYVVLTDDNATVNSREVLGYWSLGSARTITVGRSMPLSDLELYLAQP